MAPVGSESAPPDLDRTSAHDHQRSRVRIERNGKEYLVTINGAAFVALSRAQAEAIARRTRRPAAT